MGQPGQAGNEMGNGNGNQNQFGPGHPQHQPAATYTDYSQMNSVAANHMSQVGNAGFAATNSPTGQSMNQVQGWGGFQESPNQVVAGVGAGPVQGGDIQQSHVATMSHSSGDRQYCSQIYGQPGTGVHPSFDPGQSQQFAATEPPPPAQPISVSTIPPEQKPKQLELDQDLYLWLIDMCRRYPNSSQWQDEVCKDDRVSSNAELVTSILMSEDLFNSLLAKANEG